MNLKILVYVSAYNDAASLEKCLSALLDQTYPLTTILLYDNSPNKYRTVVDDRITYVHDGTNKGISQTLNSALRIALDESYDFVWTFDQDSLPETTLLASMIDRYIQLREGGLNIGILAPMPVDNIALPLLLGIEKSPNRFKWIYPQNKESLRQIRDQNIVIDAPITSGALMSTKILRDLDLPLSDYFIDSIDLDLGMQITKAGYTNVVASDLSMLHHIGTYETQSSRNALRNFYHYRNMNMLYRKYYGGAIIPLAYYLYRAIRDILRILLFEPDKVKKILAIISGIIDGFNGKLGMNCKYH